ncbi:M20 family metallopeptidase [Eubacteriales bacterium OttesenSCG-928-K08]|nr:M20 family metallopeptidase [Eubacteriales bacterium OttesenSCG-928-K08]
MMNRFYERALALKDEIVQNRRTIHTFGGVGFELPQTVAFIKEKLQELGLEPKEVCQSGITCTIGSGAPVILLRADMDALPVREESGLDFACENGTMHGCGHDMHAAMLLGAAKILQENVHELRGTVKLMFQPAEEILAGAEAMIQGGILENPHVDAAMGIHVGVGRPDCWSNYVSYISGPASTSADEFWTTINNGDRRGTSPIDVGCRIIQALQELPAMEISPFDPASLVVNVFSSTSTAANVTPSEATFKGVIRTTSPATRERMKTRMEEITNSIAATYHHTAKIEYVRGVGPMMTDDSLVQELVGYIKDIVGEKNMEQQPYGQGAEDFSAICREVPGAFFNLGAGHPDEGYWMQNHKSNVIFNEDVLPTGAAMYAACAFEWLHKHGG